MGVFCVVIVDGANVKKLKKVMSAKKFSDYICEAKKYPELDKVVVKLSNEFKLRINQEIKNIDSDVNNKAEYVAQEISKVLERFG